MFFNKEQRELDNLYSSFFKIVDHIEELKNKQNARELAIKSIRAAELDLMIVGTAMEAIVSKNDGRFSPVITKWIKKTGSIAIPSSWEHMTNHLYDTIMYNRKYIKAPDFNGGADENWYNHDEIRCIVDILVKDVLQDQRNRMLNFIGEPEEDKPDVFELLSNTILPLTPYWSEHKCDEFLLYMIENCGWNQILSGANHNRGTGSHIPIMHLNGIYDLVADQLNTKYVIRSVNYWKTSDF